MNEQEQVEKILNKYLSAFGEGRFINDGFNQFKEEILKVFLKDAVNDEGFIIDDILRDLLNGIIKESLKPNKLPWRDFDKEWPEDGAKTIITTSDKDIFIHYIYDRDVEVVGYKYWMSLPELLATLPEEK